MQEKVFFHEEQRFRQWWVWIILFAVILIFIYGMFQQFVLGKPFGNQPAPDWALAVSGAVPLLMIIFFSQTRLITEIYSDGIYYRFFPFHTKIKKITWDEIESREIRKYHPIREYGGWGFRYSKFGKGRALNISGNIGLQLVLKNGKKLLIGTQQDYALIKAIEKAEEEHNQNLEK
ncbi:MAG: DUF6141 family protein [Lentimicrobiaceae bacterium]|nr:DUF6141 family protein [Lentimicrobiaceae bacterium]